MPNMNRRTSTYPDVADRLQELDDAAERVEAERAELHAAEQRRREAGREAVHAYYAGLIEESGDDTTPQARADFHEAVRTGGDIVGAWRTWQIAQRLDGIHSTSLRHLAGQPHRGGQAHHCSDFGADLAEVLDAVMQSTPEVAGQLDQWTAGAEEARKTAERSAG